MISRMTTSVEQARAHQRRLEGERHGARRARRARLEPQLHRAASRLREGYAVTDVTLFGSLATGDLSGDIDVDLAVTGLDTTRYFEALADLMALFGGPVDLVRLEEAPPSLRQRVDAEGRAL